MPFDIVAFGEATPGANGNLLPIAAEDLYRVSGDDIFLKSKAPYLLGVLAAGTATMARLRIRQPERTDIDIFKTCLYTDLDPAEGYTPVRALPLDPQSKLYVTTVNAADEVGFAALMLGSGKITRQAIDNVSPTHIITGYSDTTITAYTWSACPITWNESLPAGKYVVVGMRAGVFLAANPWTAVARLSIPGNQLWKPGVPCTIMEADHEELQSQSYEPWQEWPFMPQIVFDDTTMPNIEVASPAAHTDENVELQLVKVE